LAKVDDPPAHDAMDRGRRAILDDARQRGAMFVLQKRRLPRRLAIQKSLRAVRVQPKNPVANDLKRHVADLRRFASRAAAVDCRQGEEPARSRPVLRSLGYPPAEPPHHNHLEAQSPPPRRTFSRSRGRIKFQAIRASHS
jgi:hypothetical protein